MNVLHSALTAMPDEQLRAIIRNRPDATFPPPPTLGALATRLALPGSISRALRRLTAADIAVLEVLGDLGAELDPVARGRLDLPCDVGAALERLRAHALVVGPDEALRVAPGVLSALPDGWRILDPAPDDLDAKLGSVSARQRQVLETLAASGSVGTTRGAAPDADPDLPVPSLIALGLLVRVNSTTVRLPRPVREALRGGRSRTYPLRPRPVVAPPEPSLVDASSTAAGLEFVRLTRRLITRLVQSPVELNKDGSVGVRAAAALRTDLGADPALPVTVGEAAGLVGRGPVDGDVDTLAVTRDGLEWLDLALPAQWAILIAGWLASPWTASEKGRLLEDSTKVPEARTARLGVLRCFLRGRVSHEDLEADLHHFLPILASGLSPEYIDAVVREGHLVGALAHDTAAPPLKEFLNGGEIAAATAQLVPPEVTNVIPQADMTILAPGPLSPEMTGVLESFAELDSPGVASLYRVTEASVRAALNNGRTATELKKWLTDHAVGEVPQPIAFLIDDTARRHGALRAGTVASYVRSEDEGLLTQAAGKVPQLRIIAPTVAVSELRLSEVLGRLRAQGFQPAAEDSTGATLIRGPEPRLVAPTPSTIPRERSVGEAHVAAVMAALSSGADDEPAAGEAVSTLQAAARSRRHVVVGYVDKEGRGRTRTVLPLTVTAGQVDALDENTDTVVRIPLPRITKVVLA